MIKYLFHLLIVVLVSIPSVSYSQRYRPPVRQAYSINVSTSLDAYDSFHNFYLLINPRENAQLTYIIPNLTGQYEKINYKGIYDAKREIITADIPDNGRVSPGKVQVQLARNANGYYIQSYTRKLSTDSSHFEQFMYNSNNTMANVISISYVNNNENTSYFESNIRFGYKFIAGENFVFYTYKTDKSSSLASGISKKSSSLSRTFYDLDKEGKKIGSFEATYQDSEGQKNSKVTYTTYDFKSFISRRATSEKTGNVAANHFIIGSRYAYTRSAELMNNLMSTFQDTYFTSDAFDIFTIKFSIDYVIERTPQIIRTLAKLVKVGYGNELYIVNGAPDILKTGSNDEPDILISVPYPAFYNNQLKSLGLNYGLYMAVVDGDFAIVFFPKDGGSEDQKIVRFPMETLVILDNKKVNLALDKAGILQFEFDN